MMDPELAKQIVDEAKADVQLILSVFGAEDGGVAFAKFWHGFLPSLGTVYTPEQAMKLSSIIHQFAKLLRVTTGIEER